jgi:hypothetical protein
MIAFTVFLQEKNCILEYVAFTANAAAPAAG